MLTGNRALAGLMALAMSLGASPAAGDESAGSLPDPSTDHPFELVGGDEQAGLPDALPNHHVPPFRGNPNRSADSQWPEDLVIAPIPGRSPQLGWSLTLAGLYFLESMGKSQPSVVGAFAMATDNGSRAWGIGAKLRLDQDDWLLRVGTGALDVRYRYYGIGNPIGDLGINVDVRQDGPLHFASASYRLFSEFYLGAGYAWGYLDTRFSLERSSDIIPTDPVFRQDTGAITLPYQFDTRDHEFSPRSGWLVEGRGALFRQSVGSDFDTDIFRLSVNRYLPMRDEDVLAMRATYRYAAEGAPFFLLSTFGGKTDLRGYPEGRYRDRRMYAVQAEYRWRRNEQWFYTGFAGVGEVAREFSDFGDNFLPAAGIGVRWIVSAKHQVSLSVDFAVGRDGAEFYVGLGEAF